MICSLVWLMCDEQEKGSKVLFKPWNLFYSGAPGRIWTCDLLIRRKQKWWYPVVTSSIMCLFIRVYSAHENILTLDKTRWYQKNIYKVCQKVCQIFIEALVSPTTHFNPRPHAGATNHAFKFFPAICVSIHALAWGATLMAILFDYADQFQSTPPHGGRLMWRKTRGRTACSNPRPRMGVDMLD